jgi:hypothetical protein
LSEQSQSHTPTEKSAKPLPARVQHSRQQNNHVKSTIHFVTEKDIHVTTSNSESEAYSEKTMVHELPPPPMKMMKFSSQAEAKPNIAL